MPILANAKKALRVSQRKAAINSLVRSRLRTTMEVARKKPAAREVNEAFSAIDKAIKGKIIHANKGARYKHQLSTLASRAA